VCRDGTCIARGSVCSDDGLSSIDPDGKTTSCEPYRCDSTGKCLSSCSTSTDCAYFVCDPTTHTCATSSTPDAPPSSSGGCAIDVGGEGTRGSSLAALGVVVAIGAVRRRRRR
jgi:MYXO-CTERM domain-containing protein